LQHKLYYEDAYLPSFQADVIKQDQNESGQWYIVLDKTAFYPTGGGQPFDTGYINNHKVINVEELDGEIRHYLTEPLPNPIGIVRGKIDWERRFDHMQQHSGQHILSAAFEELYGYATISFHLGNEELTIDIHTDQLTEEEALAVEKRANQIILENRPIETKWVTPEEASSYPLRKELSVTEDIRLVIIPDFDYNGCGGTHPKSTGQVGSLKILDWEREKKKIRVTFVCGNRVVSQLGKKQLVLKQLSPLLNAPEDGMIPAVTKLLEMIKEKDKALESVKESLLLYEGKELLQKGRVKNGKSVIAEVFKCRSIQELQKLGRILVSLSPDILAILVSESEERVQVVCARGANANGNMKIIISELLPAINGKGGGNDTFAQGGGDNSLTGEQLINRAMAILN
jgi:alanyl-tRNA synthetase